MVHCIFFYSYGPFEFYIIHQTNSIALKDKSQKEINKAIKEIIKESQPKSIRSDNGSEFISKEFKKILHDNNINQVLSTPGLPQSNGNIERFNGILKNLITKDLLYNNTYNWYKSLPRLIENYNNTYQSTIRDTPNNIITDPDKLIEIRRRIYRMTIIFCYKNCDDLTFDKKSVKVQNYKINSLIS